MSRLIEVNKNGIIFADASPMRAGESITDYTERLVDEMSDNRCVYCGEIIPEGRQVCPTCEQQQTEATKAEKFDRVLNDWIAPLVVIGLIVIGYLLIRG